MIVTRLELVDFRNYAAASFEFHHGITAVVGLNGQGKTNLAEAMAYLATLDSFRGAPAEALIRVGADTALAQIERQFGKGSIMRLGEADRTDATACR